MHACVLAHSILTHHDTFSICRSQCHDYSYVKYAVAAYGDSAIAAANMDLNGTLDMRQGNWTRKRISEHVGLPEKDLIVLDVDYSGNATELRHFVAVDHQHQKVVFCIRGTFCASECAVDIEGYSRKYMLVEIGRGENESVYVATSMPNAFLGFIR